MPRACGVSTTSATRPIRLSLSPIRVARWEWWRRIGLPICWILITFADLLISGSGRRSRNYSATCSASPSRRRACKVDTLMLRRAATERGESCRLRASTSAPTILERLDEPSDFATTSCMPSVSNTARIGPPAMMPVPGGAARRNTRPAPWRPATSWCSVRPSRSGTRMRPRLAASVALRIASGTSRALPWPKPTRPFSSPTTTSAAKPKRRPPFTTLATRLMWTSLSVNSLSRSSRSRRSRGSRAMILFQLVLVCRRSSSETEPALARRVRQRLDAAVVEVTAAIEHDLLDALRRCALGEPFADRLCRLDIGAGLEGAAHVLLQRGGGCEGLAVRVVDHLRINVFRRAEDRKPRATAGGAAHVAPHFRRPPQGSISDGRHRALPSFLLAFFAEDVFARVLDALAFIGFGLAESADFGSDVADLLLVDAGDDDLGRLGYRDRGALRDRINDIVTVAELDLQVLALQGGAIADAADLESALETFGDSRHRISEQRPAGPPHGARALGIGARIDLDFAALHLGRHIAVQRDRKRALGALHLDELALHAGGDASGNRNGFFSDTGHG